MSATAEARIYFPFYGGKWRAAPLYPHPEWRAIVEPFAGSAGYALRYASAEVTLYDRDPLIVALWDYLLHVSESEIRSLPLKFASTDELAVCQEARWLIGFWINHGMTAPCKTPSAWMRAGWRPKSWWGPEIRERIAAQLHLTRHWRIECRSFEAVDNRYATWYVDPPYNNRVGRRYRHSVIDYPALAAWVLGRRGQVIVCEQEGAEWLPFKPLGLIKSGGGRLRNGHSREVVYTA